MGEFVPLPIKSSQGEPLVHKFYTHRSEAKGLMVTFPGDHYGVDGPALYYPNKLLDLDGWDTLLLTYGYQARSESFSIEKIPEIMQECAQAVSRVLADTNYPHVVLLGKSLGCGVAAFLCQSHPALKNAKAIYLTPPLGTAGFDPLFGETSNPALLVIGTADRFYEEGVFEKMGELRDFQWLVLHGLTHSLDKPGDLKATLQAIEMITKRIVDFVTV